MSEKYSGLVPTQDEDLSVLGECGSYACHRCADLSDDHRQIVAGNCDRCSGYGKTCLLDTIEQLLKRSLH